MYGAEKDHVPIFGKLLNISAELRIEIGGEHRIVFENQDARMRVLTRPLNHRQVTAQTSVSAGKTIPDRRNLKFLTVERRKPNDLINAKFGESLLNSLPAIRPLVQIDTNLVGKKIVKVHRQTVLGQRASEGTAHLVNTPGSVAGFVAVPYQLLSRSPDQIQFFVIRIIQNILDFLFQIFPGHWKVMLVFYEPEFLKGPADGVICQQQRSSGRNLKIFGHQIFIDQAVSKPGPATVNLLGISSPHIFIALVIVLTVITRMRVIDN